MGVMEMVFTEDRIRAMLETASALVGLPVIYDDALFSSLNLDEINMKDFTTNDDLLRAGMTLEQIIEPNLVPLRLKGQSAAELRQTFQDLPSVEKVIDVLSVGSRPFMIPAFVPNGCAEVSAGGSYSKMKPICNDAFVKLIRCDPPKALVFSKDALISSGQLDKLHVNTTEWAPKPGKINGRVCLNASKSSKNFPSFNESIDYEQHDAMYEMPVLPLLDDVAEMACQQRDLYPGEQLGGATVDVSAAYQQTPQSVGTAMLTNTIATTYLTTAGRVIHLIVMYLVGMFGCSRAGNVYCTCAKLIDELHNKDSDVRRSLTYIDDGILINPRPLLASGVKAYCYGIEALFVNGSVDNDKIFILDNALTCIGWTFDFVTWTMRPTS